MPPDPYAETLKVRHARGETLSAREMIHLGNLLSVPETLDEKRARKEEKGRARGTGSAPVPGVAGASVEERRLRAADPASLKPIDRLRLVEFDRLAAERDARAVEMARVERPESTGHAPTLSRVAAVNLRALRGAEAEIKARLASSEADNSFGLIRYYSEQLEDVRQKIEILTAATAPYRSIA